MPAKKPAPGPQKPKGPKRPPAKEVKPSYPIWTGFHDPKTPVFVLMMNVTESGAAQVDNLTEHYDWLRDAAKRLKGTLLGYFVTLGPHDIVAVVTLPDDESAFDLATQLTRHGWVSTTTMRGFSLDILVPFTHH